MAAFHVELPNVPNIPFCLELRMGKRVLLEFWGGE